MTAAVCPSCGTEWATGLLACPGCHALVHADQLRSLAQAADAAGAAGDRPTEMARWREALDLLPHDSRQYQTIAEKLEHLGKLPASPSPAIDPNQSWLRRSWGALAAGLVLLLTKGKFLLAGLLKLPTLLSMFAAFGVYWAIWGWKFALGIILTTYVHEMGHVAALVRYGIKASAPMFIPGVGAFVRLKQPLTSPAHDARVGLAGPLYGLAAGVVCFAVGRATGSGTWLAIAHFTAYLNLFNLIPIWQLDGGRAFNALSTRDRWLAVLVLGLAWYASSEGLLVLLALAGGWRAFQKNQQPSDPGALALFGALAMALAWLTRVEVPLPPR